MTYDPTNTPAWKRLLTIETMFKEGNERDRLAREAAATAASFPRVIARYLTDAGKALGDKALAVTVTETGPRDDEGRSAFTVGNCTVCPAATTEFWETAIYGGYESDVRLTVTEAAQGAEQVVRRWAEAHATRCRELPVEG
ncbi:hypothetical protein [Streptomyces sp. NPDC087300]|uniref:hypothetical protein n=1 Tax=Streptomyces sp. NPDC087300 TaxID=3365780 RepID=UPI003808F039